MEKAYWLKRELASLKLAKKAGGSEAGMIHYDLAGRYSVKAKLAGDEASLEDPPSSSEPKATDDV